MFHAAPFRRKMIKEIETFDAEMRSRYDKIHRDDGVGFTLVDCFALVEIFNVMVELRLKAEYGDYLAYTCTALKGEAMSDMIWKVEKLDWQAIGERIRTEEAMRVEREERRLSPVPTPYLDEVAKAASRLGYEESLVRYQIMAYADRNYFCHSGIKGMIQSGYFSKLGERILEDLRSLEIIFRDRPHEQIEMRRIIKLVEKEWFLRLWFDDTVRQRQVMSVLTEKANQKMLSLAPAALAYADCNNFCHSGIKAIAQNGDFIELGERILEDIRSLDVIFRDLPREQIEMRSVIKLVEKEWFCKLRFDGTGRQRRLKFLLMDKGPQKLRNIAPVTP